MEQSGGLRKLSRIGMVWRIVAAMVLSGSGVLLTASSASAAPTCSTGAPHCWMIANFGPLGPPKGFLGEESAIRETCLSVSNPSSTFDDVETWIESGSSNWIEAGISYGAPEGAQKYFFWADQRPGYTYYEHDDTTDTVASGTYYNFNIYQASSTSYHVTDGLWNGLSQPWPTGYLFDTLQTGSETLNGATGASIRSNHTELEYYDQTDTLTLYWKEGLLTTFPNQNPSTWGTVTTVSPNYSYTFVTVNSC